MLTLVAPSGQALMNNMIDIAAPVHGVDVQINRINNVLHVNVDGICILRICRIPETKFTVTELK